MRNETDPNQQKGRIVEVCFLEDGGVPPGFPDRLKGTVGEASRAPGRLNGTPDRFNGAPGRLNGTPGRFNGTAGRLGRMLDKPGRAPSNLNPTPNRLGVFLMY